MEDMSQVSLQVRMSRYTTNTPMARELGHLVLFLYKLLNPLPLMALPLMALPLMALPPMALLPMHPSPMLLLPMILPPMLPSMNLPMIQLHMPLFLMIQLPLSLYPIIQLPMLLLPIIQFLISPQLHSITLLCSMDKLLINTWILYLASIDTFRSFKSNFMVFINLCKINFTTYTYINWKG